MKAKKGLKKKEVQQIRDKLLARPIELLRVFRAKNQR